MASAEQQTADPCALVIFGATGDLTKRKLMPALYNLARSGLLPDDFAVFAFARRVHETEDFRRWPAPWTRMFTGSDFMPSPRSCRCPSPRRRRW